eukprot:Awhi_evm1s749
MDWESYGDNYNIWYVALTRAKRVLSIPERMVVLLSDLYHMKEVCVNGSSGKSGNNGDGSVGSDGFWCNHYNGNGSKRGNNFNARREQRNDNKTGRTKKNDNSNKSGSIYQKHFIKGNNKNHRAGTIDFDNISRNDYRDEYIHRAGTIDFDNISRNDYRDEYINRNINIDNNCHGRGSSSSYPKRLKNANYKAGTIDFDNLSRNSYNDDYNDRYSNIDSNGYGRSRNSIPHSSRSKTKQRTKRNMNDRSKKSTFDEDDDDPFSCSSDLEIVKIIEAPNRVKNEVNSNCSNELATAWTCTVCTYVNLKPDFLMCELCNSERSRVSSSSTKERKFKERKGTKVEQNRDCLDQYECKEIDQNHSERLCSTSDALANSRSKLYGDANGVGDSNCSFSTNEQACYQMKNEQQPSPLRDSSLDIVKRNTHRDSNNSNNSDNGNNGDNSDNSDSHSTTNNENSTGIPYKEENSDKKNGDTSGKIVMLRKENDENYMKIGNKRYNFEEFELFYEHLGSKWELEVKDQIGTGEDIVVQLLSEDSHTNKDDVADNDIENNNSGNCNNNSNINANALEYESDIKYQVKRQKP